MDRQRLDRIVIVGASLAGTRAASHLRRLGHEGTITLLGAESHLPYDRPPLSKSMLTDDLPSSEVTFNDEAYYRELDVELRLGAPASSLDVSARNLTVGEGKESEKLSFDGLIISTGAHAIWLPGTRDVEGVHVLRTIDDTLAVRDALTPGARLVVIGAGFIGSEVAAAGAKRGCSVTVVEAAPAPLMRGLGSQMGTLCGALHQANGVELRLGVGVESVVAGGGPDPAVEAVQLADGTRLDADVVVIGVGVRPATDWLADSGLTIDNGVVCDGTLHTGVDGIYAAGDVVRAPNVKIGPEAVRVEHWTAATEQGMLAAANLLSPNEATAYDSVPFVWSDQYDSRIQIAGHPGPDDEVAVLVGTPGEGPFLAGYRRGERLTGVMALDAIRPFVKYRRQLMLDPTWTGALALAEELK